MNARILHLLPSFLVPTLKNVTKIAFITVRHHLTKFLPIIRQSWGADLIDDSHSSLKSSHSCKLNTVASVAELTYLHVVFKCESLLGDLDKAPCTVTMSTRIRLIHDYETLEVAKEMFITLNLT